MGARLVRGGRRGHAGAALTALPAPWWDGPPLLPKPDRRGPVDLVLLDRDGTLNVQVEGGYVTRPEELRLLPGAADAVGRLTAAGLTTVLVTNQRGVARGLMTAADLQAVHDRLRTELASDGGRLDAIAVCPHERGTCRCRKPRPGLFEEVLRRAPWAEPGRCVMLGDMPGDLAPAEGLGMRAEGVSPSRPLSGLVTDLLAR